MGQGKMPLRLNPQIDRFEIDDSKRGDPHANVNARGGKDVWQIFKNKVLSDYSINLIDFSGSINSELMRAKNLKYIVDRLEKTPNSFTAEECFYIEGIVKRAAPKSEKIKSDVRCVGTQVDPDLMDQEFLLMAKNVDSKSELSLIREKTVLIEDPILGNRQKFRACSYVNLPIKILQKEGTITQFSEERLYFSIKKRFPDFTDETIDMIAFEVIQGLYQENFSNYKTRNSSSYKQIADLIERAVDKCRPNGRGDFVLV